MGKFLSSLYPSPNLNDPNNRYNYVFNTLQPANRTDLKMRFDYNISNNTKAYVRAAIEGEETENARGIWWSSVGPGAADSAVGTNKGRSVSGNVVSVLSPTMTNEVLVSWSRLTLDNAWRDPSKVSLRSYPELARLQPGLLPEPEPRTCRSTSSPRGGARADRATCGRRRWTCSPTTTRCSSPTSSPRSPAATG